MTAKRINRDARGRVGAGNELALKHGLRRFQAKGLLPDDVQASVDAFRARLTSDQGGDSDDATAIRLGYQRRLVEVEAMLQLLANDLRTNGVITARGRTRNSVMTFLQTLDRWDRLAQRLGMERRAKKVPTIDEFMRSREQSPSSQTGDDA